MQNKYRHFAKRFLLFVIVLLIGTLVYFGCRIALSQSRVSDIASQVEKIAAPEAVNTSRSAANSLGVSSRPWNQSADAPPENTPLTSIWQLLKAKADAGDAYASCRLAMELLRCSLYNKYEVAAAEKNDKRNELATKDANTTEREWKRINSMKDRYATNASVCKGFQNTEDLSSDLYILQSALLGHEGAKQFVATVPSADMVRGNVNFDMLVARKEYAMKFLNELAGKGNQSAISELAFLFAGKSRWNQLGLKGVPDVSYADAAVYAIAADLLETQRRATNPRPNDSPEQFSMLQFLSLDKSLPASELQIAEAKAKQLLASTSPPNKEAESRKAMIQDIYRGFSSSYVVMCRAE